MDKGEYYMTEDCSSYNYLRVERARSSMFMQKLEKQLQEIILKNFIHWYGG